MDMYDHHTDKISDITEHELTWRFVTFGGSLTERNAVDFTPTLPVMVMGAGFMQVCIGRDFRARRTLTHALIIPETGCIIIIIICKCCCRSLKYANWTLCICDSSVRSHLPHFTALYLEFDANWEVRLASCAADESETGERVGSYRNSVTGRTMTHHIRSTLGIGAICNLIHGRTMFSRRDERNCCDMNNRQLCRLHGCCYARRFGEGMGLLRRANRVSLIYAVPIKFLFLVNEQLC